MEVVSLLKGTTYIIQKEYFESYFMENIEFYLVDFYFRLGHFTQVSFPFYYTSTQKMQVIADVKIDSFQKFFSLLRKSYLSFYAFLEEQQSGAVEACWAHNPEVRRSKLRSARIFLSLAENTFKSISAMLDFQILSKTLQN